MLRDVTWKDRIHFFLGRLEAYQVEGDSMLPTLKGGDAVMIERNASVSIGDIVLAQHPYKQSVKILKRVESIDAGGRYSLVGDNPDESTDSRTFGAVPLESIYGRVVCRVT